MRYTVHLNAEDRCHDVRLGRAVVTSFYWDTTSRPADEAAIRAAELNAALDANRAARRPIRSEARP